MLTTVLQNLIPLLALTQENKDAFLITYSQADIRKVLSCLRFSEIILEAFNSASSSRRIVQWACCMEEHADGSKHYHPAILFSGSCCWLAIENGISLHFSSQHIGYIAAYRYILNNEQLTDVLHSMDHPNLGSISQDKTKTAMKSNRSKSKSKKKVGINEGQGDEIGPNKRLSNIDISNFLNENDIKEKKKLYCVAKDRAAASEPDLCSFIVSKNPKSVSDLIMATWEIKNAAAEIEQQNRTRIDIVISCAQQARVDGCNGIWLQRALQVLHNNNINVYSFSSAVRNCLRYGRKKSNVFFFGPTNSAMSFPWNQWRICSSVL